MAGGGGRANRGFALAERAGIALLIAAVAAFCVTSIPGVHDLPGYVALYDAGLQCTAYVLCALVALLLAFRTPVERLTWGLLSLALALRAAGFVTNFVWVRWQTSPPYPSIADACWLASDLVLVLVLLVRARALLPQMTLLAVLDAVAGAILAAGLVLVVVFEDIVTVVQAPEIDRLEWSTILAYPVEDVVLLVISVGLLAGTGLWPRRSDLVLFVAVAGLAVLDVAFLDEIYEATFRPAAWVQPLSLATTALLAVVPLVARAGSPPAPAQLASREITAAATIATTATAFFVYASLEAAPVTSTLLVAAALMVSIIRGAATLLGDRSAAVEALREVNEDLLRFQALVEASQDFIAIAGMDGQVMYVNPAGRDMVGMPRDRDLASVAIVDFLTDEGIRACIEVEQPAVVAHGHWEGESTLRDHRGGPPIPVAISSFLMHHPRTGEPFALATVQRDITDRRAAAKAVEDLARQRQFLLARLVRAQDDERAAIAADVHDDSVQALAAVDLRLGLLRRNLAELEEPELLAHMDKAMETVREATARLRHLLFDLESPAQSSCLADALSAAADFVFDETPIAWEVTGDRSIDLPTAQRVTAYRIAKEAMTNARKHSQATRVEIGVARGEAGVLVTVADDGVGMSRSVRHRPGHHGLASGRDRATIAGGWLRVEGAQGDGTRVFVWLPDIAPTDDVDLDEDDEGPVA